MFSYISGKISAHCFPRGTNSVGAGKIQKFFTKFETTFPTEASKLQQNKTWNELFIYYENKSCFFVAAFPPFSNFKVFPSTWKKKVCSPAPQKGKKKLPKVLVKYLISRVGEFILMPWKYFDLNKNINSHENHEVITLSRLKFSNFPMRNSCNSLNL